MTRTIEDVLAAIRSHPDYDGIDISDDDANGWRVRVYLSGDTLPRRGDGPTLLGALETVDAVLAASY